MLKSRLLVTSGTLAATLFAAVLGSTDGFTAPGDYRNCHGVAGTAGGGFTITLMEDEANTEDGTNSAKRSTFSARVYKNGKELPTVKNLVLSKHECRCADGCNCIKCECKQDLYQNNSGFNLAIRAIPTNSSNATLSFGEVFHTVRMLQCENWTSPGDGYGSY